MKKQDRTMNSTVDHDKQLEDVEEKHFFYVLTCNDGSWYAGYTNNLDHRLKMHQSGKGAKYTRAHLPVECFYSECYGDKTAALKREAAFKKLTRSQKEGELLEFGVTLPLKRPITRVDVDRRGENGND
ncbi:GIY-YIG nuclease family protein [Bavariicoccus seileri]|uniref:GIY-YIG nuclease family protein n=1 Tax=Bavariicoccus seileri TaxID=549685 RepID=UPI0003B5CDEF|nr:GIY-YIG nuclease family protein [Bavariicoccus seileri]